MGHWLKKRSEWRLLLMIALLLIPCIVLANRSYQENQVQWDNGFVAGLESYVKGNLPFRRQLQEISLRIGLFGGRQEQSGVFISQNALVKNILPPRRSYEEDNTQAILAVTEYASDLGVPVYLALIPTACAIRQEDLPRFADTFNQRQFIEKIYSRMYGRVSTVDLYTPLFSNRSRYLYYRTQDGLTAAGGYMIYDALGERMGISNRSLEQYDITFSTNFYYGDLYQLSPYKTVQPDALTMYHFGGATASRNYLVTHHQGGEKKQYHTLYPTHLGELDRELDIYLGGLSAVVQIDTVANNRKLLVFGDDTALAYLPFLCNHYGQVTLIDLRQPTANYEDLTIDGYDQVLFAYSVETYMKNNVLERAHVLLSEEWDG